MKRILLVMIAAVVLTADAAHADRGRVYAVGSLGYGVVADGLDIQSDIGIDSGWGLIAAVGYDTNKFRVEGEISYRTYDLDELDFDAAGELAVDGDFTAYNYMMNGFYDFKMRGSPLRPFLGLGFGITHVDIDLAGLGSTGSTELAYQFLGGVSLRSRENWFLRTGYRLFGYSDNDGLLIHEVNLGVGYMF